MHHHGAAPSLNHLIYQNCSIRLQYSEYLSLAKITAELKSLPEHHGLGDVLWAGF